MPRKLTGDEVAARCQCDLPLDDPAGHRSRCPIAVRAYQRTHGRSDRRQQVAADIAAQLARARAYLASGGRPGE